MTEHRPPRASDGRAVASARCPPRSTRHGRYRRRVLVSYSVDIDVVTRSCPRHRDPEPGGLSAASCSMRSRRICLELPVCEGRRRRGLPAPDHADITVAFGQPGRLEALSAIARKRAGTSATARAVGPVAALLSGRLPEGPPRSPALPLMPQPAPVCRWCARPPARLAVAVPRRPRPRRDLAHRRSRDSPPVSARRRGPRSSATSSPRATGFVGRGQEAGREGRRPTKRPPGSRRGRGSTGRHTWPDPAPAGRTPTAGTGWSSRTRRATSRGSWRVLPRVHRRHADRGPRCPPHHRRRRWRPLLHRRPLRVASGRSGRGHERTARAGGQPRRRRPPARI